MSEFLDRLEKDIQKLQKNSRESDLGFAIEDLDFKSSQAKIDFQTLLITGARQSGAGYEGPGGQSLREFAKQEYERRPELHKAQPEEKPSEVPAAAARSRKSFQIEQIRPEMSESEVREAWAAIQQARGVEPRRGE